MTIDRPQPDEGLAAELWYAGRAWDQAWADRRKTPPAKLFHYTDASGLLGIVTRNELWASNAAFLNDATELLYIQGVLEDVLAELETEYDDAVVGGFLALMSGVFDRLYSQGMEVFVACFCEGRDLLSQWRGYPSSDGGYAIGFRDASLTAAGFLLPVIYDEKTQREVLRSLLTAQCDLLPKIAGEPPGYQDKCLALSVQIGMWSLADCAFAFKHPKFAEEAEWRLVRVTMGDREPPVGIAPMFRVRGRGLLPYTTFALTTTDANKPISEIVVGPSRHPDLAEGAARRLLGSSGYGMADGIVTRSEIPLRV